MQVQKQQAEALDLQTRLGEVACDQAQKETRPHQKPTFEVERGLENTEVSSRRRQLIAEATSSKLGELKQLKRDYRDESNVSSSPGT